MLSLPPSRTLITWPLELLRDLFPFSPGSGFVSMDSAGLRDERRAVDEVTLSLQIEQRPEEVVAELLLQRLGEGFRVTGRAPRTHGLEAHPPIALDLALARALRALEAEVMESVHERIDRFIADE